MSVLHAFRSYRTRLLLLFAVVGPGIITANVDNDAGGITTYSVAGAQYGYHLLWLMPPVLIALIIVQEMAARLGVITGKGLADLIRENMGVRLTTIVLLLLVLANLANTVSEFAGIAASMQIFGVSKYLSIPIAAALVWMLIVRGSYKLVERIFLIASAVYFCYIASGVMAHPDWSSVLSGTISPSFHFTPGFLAMAITVIGTTIAPWMQFYQQSAIVDKNLQPSDYRYERIDVIVGSLIASAVAVFIMISCAATLHAQHIQIQNASDAAVALKPLAGRYASLLFALGLLNASLFSAAILPLSTAYGVCEAFGWESGIGKGRRRAPVFFWIFTAFIVVGGAVILLPVRSLVEIMVGSQTLNGVLLPVILIVMLRLVNDRGLMGDKVNGPAFNVFTWVIVGALIALTGAWIYTSIVPAA